MGVKKKAKKKASGRNISEAERNTERVTLRLDPETMSDLRELAEEMGVSIADVVDSAMTTLFCAKLDLADKTGMDVYMEFIGALKEKAADT